MGRAFEFRKARKFKRWAKISKTYSRIGKDIVVAIKSGGPDPEANAKLRAVMQNAKHLNVPKNIIDRAIKKAKDKDISDYKEVTFEGYGPHGIAVIVETTTDNNQRTVANIRSYFNKCNGRLGTVGSVSFMFDHQCHFKIPKEDLDEEELELELIDYGAEEVFIEEETLMIYGPFENFGAIQSALEEMGIEILASGFERIPATTKKLAEEESADIEKLLEKIEEDDDVQNVYHNWEEG